MTAANAISPAVQKLIDKVTRFRDNCPDRVDWLIDNLREYPPTDRQLDWRMDQWLSDRIADGTMEYWHGYIDLITAEC